MRSTRACKSRSASSSRGNHKRMRSQTIVAVALGGFVASAAVAVQTQTPTRTQTQTAATPQYVGSKSCQRCHAPTYDRWSKTRMANVVRDPKEHPDAVLPD